MEALDALRSLGIELPGPAYIVGALLFGVAGLLAFRRGRKLGRRRTTWLGVALMLYPYLVTSTLWLYAVGAALCVAIALDRP